MEKKRRSFITGAAILAFAGIVCKIIGVLFRVWAAGTIGEAGMEYYEVVFPFYSFLLILSSSGIPTAISKMVAERIAVGDWASGKRVFRRSLLALSLIGIISTAVMYLASDVITVNLVGLPSQSSIIFKALSPALFFVSVLCAYRGYLQGLQKMAGTGVSQIAEQVFKCIFGLWLAAYFIRTTSDPIMGAVGALLGISISEAAALIIMMLLRYKHRRDCMPLDAERKPRQNERVISKMLAIAVPITLGASILPITSIIDVDMIYAMTNIDNVGQSYVALSTYVRSIINLPASLTVALAISLVPAISAARARMDEQGVQRASTMGVKLSMIIGLPCAVGLYVLGAPIVNMIFRSIEPSTLEIVERLFKVASFTVIFISLVQTTTGALQGIGKQWIPMVCLLIGAVCKVVTNYVLLPIAEINIVGASWSNIACYGVAGILDTIFLVKYTKMKMNIWDVFIKPVLGSAVMGAVVYFVYKFLYSIHPGTIVTLVSVVIGIGVYLAMIYVLRMFTKDEMAYLPLNRRRRKEKAE